MKIISTIFGGLGLAGLTIMGLMWMSGYNPFNPPVKTQQVVQSSNQTLRNWDNFPKTLKPFVDKSVVDSVEKVGR